MVGPAVVLPCGGKWEAQATWETKGHKQKLHPKRVSVAAFPRPPFDSQSVSCFYVRFWDL